MVKNGQQARLVTKKDDKQADTAAAARIFIG